MGQTKSTCAQEEKMSERIANKMRTYDDFALHLSQANEWAKLCPTPQHCYLSFRVLLHPRLTPQLVPKMWKRGRNVLVEVRKNRRQEHEISDAIERERNGTNPCFICIPTSTECIGQAKIVTIHQFYCIYNYLSDVKACALHTIPTNGILDHTIEEMECPICMDERKQIVLECTHSFCLTCVKNWSGQQKSCPTCRASINCTEGEDLWQLMTNEIDDISSYANDLIARIYEFLELGDSSDFMEKDFTRSEILHVEAQTVQSDSITMTTVTDYVKTYLPISLSSEALQYPGSQRQDWMYTDSDFALALELAAGEDQFAAIQFYQQNQRDQEAASTSAIQVDRT